MVTKWTDIDAPWLERDDFIDLVIDKCAILDILDLYGVQYYACQSGEFTHRAKCPLPAHGNGEERTPSFFISESQNRFYCFGCNCGSSVIDLVSMYSGRPFYESVAWLAKRSGLTADNLVLDAPEKKKKDPEKMVSNYVYKTGLIIRDFLEEKRISTNYIDCCKWADKRFLQLDEFFDSLSDDDWKKAKDYYEQVIESLEAKRK